MDQLTLFGLIAATAMLIFYALEDHSPWFILAVAAYRWRIRTLPEIGSHPGK